MRYFVALVLASSALISCHTVGPCDLAPVVEDWEPVKAVPAALTKVSGHAGPWYVDPKGQYIACTRQGRDLCSGNYAVYAASKDSFVRVDMIVCLASHVRPNNSFKPSPLRGLGQNPPFSGGPA